MERGYGGRGAVVVAWPKRETRPVSGLFDEKCRGDENCRKRFEY